MTCCRRPANRSGRSAPRWRAAPEIRQFVRRLYARLSAGRSAEWALRAFADEPYDPLGDLVATGLLIAVTRGGQTEQVLSALADQARSQADRRRIVEAERARCAIRC